jgi:hypothetical protein
MAGCLVVGLIAPAAAVGPVPAWRIVHRTLAAESIAAESLVASGHSTAWSLWSYCTPCGGVQDAWFAELRARGRWRSIPVPESLLVPPRHPTWPSAAVVAMGASSAADAWLFLGYNDRRTALRWNGRRWRKQGIPGWVIQRNAFEFDKNVALDFGGRDMWVFSLDAGGFGRARPYAARYDGARWTRASLPGVITAVSALSASDIWAVGFLKTHPRTFVVMHWTGHRWQVVTIPTAGERSSRTYFLSDPVAVSSSDVWLTRSVRVRHRAKPDAQFLLNWNGASWTRVGFGLPTAESGYMTQDGHGGLWLADIASRSSGAWFFDHLHSDGTWTRQPVPAMTGGIGDVVIEGMAYIPGTRSVWATAAYGAGIPNANQVGVILNYVP